MKANELMIGDLVITPAGIAKVLKIDGDNNTIVICQHDGRLNGGLVDEAKPIQLTTEILEKSGLEHNKGEMYYHGKLMYHHESKYVSICYGANNYWHLHINNGCDFSKAIKYVHELQHALKLCGIEKTIEL